MNNLEEIMGSPRTKYFRRVFEFTQDSTGIAIKLIIYDQLRFLNIISLRKQIEEPLYCIQYSNKCEFQKRVPCYTLALYDYQN